MSLIVNLLHASDKVTLRKNSVCFKASRKAYFKITTPVIGQQLLDLSTINQKLQV